MKAIATIKIATPVMEGTTGTGTKFKKFGGVVTKGGVKKEGKPDVFGVVIFGKKAEANYRTGDTVTVDGELTVEDFQIASGKPAVQTALINAYHIDVVPGNTRLYAKAYNVLGNITRDAEIKTFGQNGDRSVAKTGLASNRKIGQNELTSFVNLALFDKQGTALAPYLAKGKKVLVDGALSAHYYDKQDGSKGLDVSISVDDFQFAGGGQGGSANAQNASAPDTAMPANTMPEIDIDEEEIPF